MRLLVEEDEGVWLVRLGRPALSDGEWCSGWRRSGEEESNVVFMIVCFNDEIPAIGKEQCMDLKTQISLSFAEKGVRRIGAWLLEELVPT